MDSLVAVSLISSVSGIVIAGIGAWATTTKAVTNAVTPLQAQIAEKDKTIAHQLDTIGQQGVTIRQLLEEHEKGASREA